MQWRSRWTATVKEAVVKERKGEFGVNMMTSEECWNMLGGPQMGILSPDPRKVCVQIC